MDGERHIAIMVSSTHGHLVPTLAVARSLKNRGYRVSYPVKEKFAEKVHQIGAQAVIYSPLDNEQKVYKEVVKDDGSCDFSLHDPFTSKWIQDLYAQEVEDSVRQLKERYRDDKPDLIIYDPSGQAGRHLASEWGIPAIEHEPMIVEHPFPYAYNKSLVMVSVPRFFQPTAELMDGRFRFIGFNPPVSKVTDDALGVYHGDREILVSATTGLLQQRKFFQAAIDAFTDGPWRVTLCVGDQLDEARVANLPANFVVNRGNSQFEILRKASLFIGQGGTGSTLEALYHGVPVILVPPSKYHDIVARRAAELGVGFRIPIKELSAQILSEKAAIALSDSAMRKRVEEARQRIRNRMDVEDPVELIDAFLREHAWLS